MLNGSRWAAALAALGAAVSVASCGSVTETPVRFVSIYPDSLTLKANRLVQLVASVTDGSGAQVTGVSVTFSSKDPLVATTTPGGLVTAVAPGTAIIVAEAGPARDSIPITVTAAGPLVLSFLDDSLTVPVGGSVSTTVVVAQDGQIVAGLPLTYVPSDSAIFVISAIGVVTGRGSGTGWAVVSAGGSRDSVRVTVFRPFAGALQTPITLPSGGAWGINISTANVMYVTQQSGSSLIRYNLPSYAAAGTVAVSPGPLDVVFSANGQTAYTVSGATNAFDIVNVAAGTSTAYPVGETPWRIRLSKDQTRLYVTTTTGTLRVFNAATGAAITSFNATNGAANGAELSSDGTKLYVSGWGGDQIAEITTATNAVRRSTIESGLQDIAVSPDGRRLYIASEYRQVKIVDAGSLLVVDSIPVYDTFGLRFTPDGNFLVATCARGQCIHIIDAAVKRVVKDFTVTDNPRRIAFDTPNGAILVTGDGGVVHVIK